MVAGSLSGSPRTAVLEFDCTCFFPSGDKHLVVETISVGKTKPWYLVAVTLKRTYMTYKAFLTLLQVFLGFCIGWLFY